MTEGKWYSSSTCRGSLPGRHTILHSTQGQFQVGSYRVPPYKAHIRVIGLYEVYIGLL